MFSNAGIQNVINGHGVGISVTGMIIVFIVLSFISIFLSLLPKVLMIVEKFLPEESETSGKSTEPDDSVIAAIAMALYKTKYNKK